MRDEKKNKWLQWAKFIFIILLLVFIIKTFMFATSTVVGESMSPTLENGEHVIYNKFVYIFGEPKRNDIIIIKRPIKNYVKRVIGLPGEIVEMKDHQLYIDGEKCKQIFISEDAINSTGNFGPIMIPPANYFVMGDNRAISKDSRNGLGFINENNIIGRAELIIFPFDQLSLTR